MLDEAAYQELTGQALGGQAPGTDISQSVDFDASMGSDLISETVDSMKLQVPARVPSASPRPQPVAAQPAIPAPVSAAMSPVEDRPTIAASPTGRPARWPLLIVVALLLLTGIGGGGYWFWKHRDGAQSASQTDAGTQQEPTWAEQLQSILGSSAAHLPVIEEAQPLREEGAFVAGGPDGLATQLGVVPGLPSTAIPKPLVDKDRGGQWVVPLKAALDAMSPSGDALLAVGLDENVESDVLAKFVYSGYKARFRHFGLVVERQGGAKGVLPFQLLLQSEPLPPGGALVVRVGSIRVTIKVQAKDGSVLSQGNDPIDHTPSKAPDMKTIDARLGELHTTHGDVEAAVIYANGNLPVHHLAAIMSRVLGGGGEPRFKVLRLAIQSL